MKRRKIHKSQASETVDYYLHTFPNGIRLVHKQVEGTQIAHCGFVLDIGSRDEKADQQGMAHFWEHMAFKGTEKRKAFHILNRLDSVGGELNAYTTKEKICFYASVLDLHFDKAVELLTDITFHSTFPEKEIQKEKGVILEEMSMYKDDPADAIADEFDEVIFGDHQLGRNILGTRESVSGFQQADFLRFIRENLSTERLVFTSVSALPMKEVIKKVGKYLSALPVIASERVRLPFEIYQPKQEKILKPISQGHCVIGTTAYSIYDEKRLPFFFLTNVLGGPGMNSRLNLGIREKYGFVYDINASYNTFSDCGLFSIYFGSEKNTLNRCIGLVGKEMKRLRERKLGVMQLHQAKQQLMGQLAIAEESNINMMLVIGKSILDLEKVESIQSIFQKIEAITAELLLDIANEIFAEEKLSMLQYLPEE
ncbi:pitrilysin family protein [Rapidithrix thailandica]|uniref:Pitrilysin family protein n=1 Tax=Rapidithrix thailandica TaxID=413964 RepID=A0AAW9SHC5_9BACT